MDGLFPEPGQGGSAVAGEYAGGSEAQPSVSRAFASMDPRWEPKGPFSRVATPFTAASTASRRCRSCIWGSICLHHSNSTWQTHHRSDTYIKDVRSRGKHGGARLSVEWSPQGED